MRKVLKGSLGLLVVGAVLAFGPWAAGAAVNALSGAPATGDYVGGTDNLPNPLGDKRAEMREDAVAGVLSGRLKPVKKNGSTVVKVGKKAKEPGSNNGNARLDQYVELSREKTDRIFVILAEFGNERHPSYPDVNTHAPTPGPITWDGPLVNQIPQPNRAVDNSTVWQPDYNQQHFQNLYFGGGESLKNYYEAQSSGRYSVEGTVTNWVRVRFNQARYGRSNGFPCTTNVCSNTWFLVQDAANQWYADQVAAGRSAADIKAELATFDVWDRYDYNSNGDFNEPDGYIDHFQIVHAGGDQADGDPIYGEDAIWSHRWYTFQGGIGSQGPTGNLRGGNQIGSSGLWIGDYTIQPENGGRSVFYHEYAHDLGLPDDYNSILGGDNNNEHWTLMAQSRLGAANDGGIGERGGDLGAWNKLQLGWLNAAVVQYNEKKNLELGPQEYNSNKPQGLVVELPQKTVTTQLGAPASGSNQWWSGDGNNLENTLTRQVTLPAGLSALMTFQARWDIEQCGPDPCDYAFVEIDDGTGFHAIPGSITVAAEGHGIDGTQAAYGPATFDLSAFAGDTVGLRFRYSTDPSAAGNDPNVPNGIFIDNIAITAGGTTVFTDGAETGLSGWTAAGFSIVGSSVSTDYDNFYIAGHRTYTSYDQYLKTGPYYFGYLNTLPDFVDHYAYQQGLLISYWDRSEANNDTFLHPGSGRNLYIDAHPEPFLRDDGAYWRARVQVYDAPFSKRTADSWTLHQNSVPMSHAGLPGQDTFDDTKKYWYAELPNHGVKLPAVGVKIRVLNEHGTSIKVKVN